MTDAPLEAPEEEQIAFPHPAYEQLAARATAAGRSYSLRESGGPRTKSVTFDLDFPSGSGERAISLPRLPRVKAMLDQPFENFRLSTNYEALIDLTSGQVEVALSSQARARGAGRIFVWDLPGVQIDDESPLKSDGEFEEWRVPSGWRLEVTSDDVQIEISAKSPMFEATYYYALDYSLKIKHAQGSGGPRADDLLNEYATDFLLDLELQYGLGLTMQKKRVVRTKRIATVSSQVEPRFPSLRYSREASAFYWYGSSASGLPLLQYLAYYQVLEYFFSSFTRRAVVERLRTRLKHPRFDMRNDTDIDSLIDASRTAHAGLKNELDQLRHTLTDCITAEAIRTFIRSDDQLSNHFLAAKAKIRGTVALRLDADDEDLIRQIAERVYRVRNRIVHTKAGAEEIGLELLLPASSESNELWPEVELVRWLAQSALVHGAASR